MRTDHFDYRGYLRCRLCGEYKPQEEFYYNKIEKYRNFRDPQCKLCESKRHKKYRIYKPKRNDLEKHLATLINGCRTRINCSKVKKYRKLTIDIDYKYLYELYKKQEGKCAISGLPMTYYVGSGRNHYNISVDRIDSNLGYIKGNVQLVCAQVNMMKAEMNYEELYIFCEAIVNNKNKYYENENKYKKEE